MKITPEVAVELLRLGANLVAAHRARRAAAGEDLPEHVTAEEVRAIQIPTVEDLIERGRAEARDFELHNR